MDSPYFFESTIYWSEGDERAHFEWLERIPSIKDVRGRGVRVFLEIRESQVSSEDIRELEAVYRRYGGDVSQLVALKDKTSE
jgi:hypothetical protein